MGYGFRTYGYRGPSYRSYGGGGGGIGWGLTPAVKLLIIINAAVFFGGGLLAAFVPGFASFIYGWFGLVPRRVLYGALWQPVTYLFLHGGLSHIFFNMFGLWMFGSPIERDWGRRRFLRYYFLTGVGAGLFSVAMTWIGTAVGWIRLPPGFDPMMIPTVGASGAIFGILLAFGLMYPTAPILVMFVFPIPARLFVIIYGIITLLGVIGQPGSTVSHVAHLGGLVVGYLYLRGPRGALFSLRKLYARWQLARARRKFRMYVHKAEERERGRSRPDDWVN